jgi:hypothetical protein
MENVLKEFLDSSIKGISLESQRLLKIKTFSLLLSALQVVRKIFLIQTGFHLICLVWALSFFSSGLLLFSENTFLEGTDRPLWFSLGTFAFCTLLIWLVGREKTWIGVLGISDQLDNLLANQLRTPTSPAAPIDYEQIANIVDRIVDKKMKQTQFPN